MIIGKNDLRDLCDQATTAALAAGEYIQSQLEKHHIKNRKTSHTSLASQVVTAVDMKAQQIILRHLEKSIEKYDLGLLTEEAIDDQSRFKKSHFWCIDPMDGTLPFTEGKSGYAVSIALVTKQGDPVIAVVYVPDKADCYTSVKGDGVRLNNEPFIRPKASITDTIHVYLDRSIQSEAYFHLLTSHLEELATAQQIAHVKYHVGFGAVCNAISVMNLGSGCYFKFPKKQRGGGSIWDYAATRLFFEEFGFPVSNMGGDVLQLNIPKTTFMNQSGILYATDLVLSDFIMELRDKLVLF